MMLYFPKYRFLKKKLSCVFPDINYGDKNIDMANVFWGDGQLSNSWVEQKSHRPDWLRSVTHLTGAEDYFHSPQCIGYFHVK